jgi:SAM-dependent methyltransferase
MTPLDCLDLYADAEFYDVEFADRNIEIPFYRRHARQSNGPVLEVACGTGRLTMPIARDGVDVTGLDVSGPMLEQAARKSTAEGLKIEWIEQDCRDMRLSRTFAMVFSATNAMQHLLDMESACAFLRSAERALQPGGQLIIDVFNPNPAKLARTGATRYLHKTINLPYGESIRVETVSEYRADKQILHFDLFYMRDGQLLRTKRVNMRCFFPEELLALCRFNGLEVLKRFGDYNESVFCEGSPKQLLFCRKAVEACP